MNLSRWIAPAALAAAIGTAAFAPAPAHAQSTDALTRAIVDIADVVFRGGQPYYRNGDYSSDDRLVVSRDRYGRPVYYRVVQDGRYGRPVYGNAYGNAYGNTYGSAYGNAYGDHDHQRVKCNKHGKCKAEYYDPRYDHRGDAGRYGYDSRYRYGSRYGYDNRYGDHNRYGYGHDDD